MKKNSYFSLDFINEKFVFLDQTKLPLQEQYIETTDYNRIAQAIERLEIRGAPAIGIAAAYGAALAIRESAEGKREEEFQTAFNRLAATRPTAVNLFHALNRVKIIFEKYKNDQNLFKYILDEAKRIHLEDIEKCSRIAENGIVIFKNKSAVLTHCNTGKLATGGDGTAFNVIKKGFEMGLVSFVYADETRPLLQGSRLTAFELEKSGIPFALQSDSSAGVLMQQHKIDLVIVGADRIALNGDTANKVGTYSLAVLCNFHNIPFYVAAPSTTIDRSILTGNDIKIEVRSKNELLSINGAPVTNTGYETFTPAFDVTPSHLITGIITDEQVFFFPYNFMQ
ncbi:MAG TPA: S-methyl-5-thioribose-1-phosphate isomerase [Ignavibacteriaceae bacterium]|nr:S-methyl-5-thioribose-1-phosphate isomerase [Ignavibacteriaceae bacterium]